MVTSLGWQVERSPPPGPVPVQRRSRLDSKLNEMPIGSYYHGHGSQVMAGMKEKYGKEKGERVFYATAKSKKQEPGSSKPKRYKSRGDPR